MKTTNQNITKKTRETDKKKSSPEQSEEEEEGELDWEPKTDEIIFPAPEMRLEIHLGLSDCAVDLCGRA